TQLRVILCSVVDVRADRVLRSDLRPPQVLLVEPLCDGTHRVHLKALGKSRLVADEPPELGSQSVGQGLGERGQQYSALRVLPGQEHRAMQGYDRLSGAGGAGHTRRPFIVALDQLALCRME